jgi:hypothetical protein
MKKPQVFVDVKVYDPEDDPRIVMYWKYVWNTGNDYLKYINEFAIRNDVEYSVALKWFLSMLVNSQYISEYFPELRRTKNQCKLFNSINLVGEDYHRVFDGFKQFKLEILKHLYRDVPNLRFFRREAEGEVRGGEKLRFTDNTQLVEMLLVIGLLSDCEVDLRDLNNVMSNGIVKNCIQHLIVGPK